MPVVLPPLLDEDPLGRAVLQSNQVKKAEKGIILHSVFLDKEELDSLSVNRLDHATDGVMAEIGDTIARGRGPNRNFYGWAVVLVVDASKDGRAVRATRQADNPYHADIDLNISAAAERREAQTEHANTLAADAEWRKRPE